MQNRDSMSDIEILTSEIVSFIQERDWDQFHTPKDTALALSIEASELNEVFCGRKIAKRILIKSGKSWQMCLYTP